MPIKLLSLLLLICLLTVPVVAQETPPIPENIDSSGVSDDAVNAIAHELYCPVCENIPLDTCGTAACADWREEIRGMIAVGMSQDDIVDNFVARFGERVVGTPQDPFLRALSLVTPYVIAALGFLVALWTLMQWQRRSVVTKMTEKTTIEEDSPYREMLEKDLVG